MFKDILFKIYLGLQITQNMFSVHLFRWACPAELTQSCLLNDVSVPVDMIIPK